jgi:hypothetical protein
METTEQTELQQVTATKSIVPKDFEEAWRFADMIAKSELAPKDYRGKPTNAMCAIIMGLEVGLSPMQAIQNIAVINGRPSLYGDAMLAVVQNHWAFEYIKETLDESNMTATCIVKRKGGDEHIVTFSRADAVKAKLWEKSGPWTDYPKRMLQMRARGFALRDQFGDALRGFNSREEQQDILDITSTASHKPIDIPETSPSSDSQGVVEGAQGESQEGGGAPKRGRPKKTEPLEQPDIPEHMDSATLFSRELSDAYEHGIDIETFWKERGQYIYKNCDSDDEKAVIWAEKEYWKSETVKDS